MPGTEEELLIYKYYVLNDSIPVMLAQDSEGLIAGAMIPDPANPNQFNWNNNYLDILLKGEGVREISKEEFETVTLLYVRQKKTGTDLMMNEI